MNIRKVRTLLWTFTAVLTLGAAATIPLMIWLPLEAPSVASANDSPAQSRTVTPPPSSLTMADFEPYVTGRLRPAPPAPAPPITPVPIVQSTPAPVAMTPGYVLVGTVTHADEKYALFQTSQGIEVKHQGDHVGDAEVVSVKDGLVELQQNRTRSMMNVPAPRD